MRVLQKLPDVCLKRGQSRLPLMTELIRQRRLGLCLVAFLLKHGLG